MGLCRVGILMNFLITSGWNWLEHSKKSILRRTEGPISFFLGCWSRYDQSVDIL